MEVVMFTQYDDGAFHFFCIAVEKCKYRAGDGM